MVGPIPAQRPGFQPRPAVLARLNWASQEAPVLVLTGTPGAGKTQLAAAYARARLAGGWRLVAWINARGSDSLRAGLAAVADAIRLSDGGSGPGAADAGRAVRRWLEADGDRCLLVFDDADDPGVLWPFVPVGGGARVLITAAAESVALLGVPIPVDAFSADEALALLAGRTGLADEAGAGAVAAELGHLPLGLDQAAAAIAGEDLGYAGYLAELRALPVEAPVEGPVEEPREEPQPYPLGVAKAVLLSLVTVEAGDLAGVCTGVMEMTAVLWPAAVRRDLLGAAGPAGLLASGGRRVAAPLVDQALAQLDERSLLGFSLDGQAVIVHRLVARVVREGLVRRGRLAAACRSAASALVAAAEALGEPPDRATVRDLLGQVTALLDNARDLADDADDKLAALLMRLRFLALHRLVELGDNLPQAIAIGESLTADLERSLGPDHHDTLNARSRLAAAYQAADRPADAIPLFEQTLAWRERLLGPDHPDTLTAQSNLAAAYQDMGRSAEAILLYRMALAGQEWLLGTDHPDTLNSLGNLATAYRHAGRVTDAVPLMEQILAARERVSGTGDPSTLPARNNLAKAYLAVDRPAEAVPLFEQNLAACERLLGPDHPRSQTTRHNLTLAREEAGLSDEPGYADGDADDDASGDVVPDDEGDGDAEGEGDLDAVGEGELDRLGDRDLDRLGDRDADGDGPAGADDESVGSDATAWD